MASRVIMAMLAKFFIFISFDAVYVYAAELFPTVIRYGTIRGSYLGWYSHKEVGDIRRLTRGFLTKRQYFELS